MGLRFSGSLPLRTRTTKEHNATALVRRGPTFCSGFNLLLIAAYSYIVNPDLAYGQAALPRIPASRRRKARPVLFHLHIVSAPQRLHEISALHSHGGVRLQRCTGCAGDRPSAWAAGLSPAQNRPRPGCPAALLSGWSW